MTLLLRWMALTAVIVTSSALKSTNIFSKEATDTWIEGVCSSNTTCRELAQTCYWQLKMARSFLSSLVNPGDRTIQDRCQEQRTKFDTCAEEAQFNATWSTITGSERACGDSFLRGGPRRSGPSSSSSRRRRHRRTAEDAPVDFTDLTGLSLQPLAGYVGSLNPDLWAHIRARRSKRGRGRGSYEGRWGSSPTSRIETFIQRVETTNPDLLQNYTACIMRQEGVLHENGTVNREQFDTWAIVAFAAQPAVGAAVRTAMEDCPEPADSQLSEYMQCWAETCVTELWPSL